jgi:hypothetical protein
VQSYHQDIHIAWTALKAALEKYLCLLTVHHSLCCLQVLCVLHQKQSTPQTQTTIWYPEYWKHLFENIQMDFTELPWASGNKYLLVCVCTFLGWVEAFLT